MFYALWDPFLKYIKVHAKLPAASPSTSSSVCDFNLNLFPKSFYIYCMPLLSPKYCWALESEFRGKTGSSGVHWILLNISNIQCTIQYMIHCISVTEPPEQPSNFHKISTLNVSLWILHPGWNIVLAHMSSNYWCFRVRGTTSSLV